MKKTLNTFQVLVFIQKLYSFSIVNQHFHRFDIFNMCLTYVNFYTILIVLHVVTKAHELNLLMFMSTIFKTLCKVYILTLCLKRV
jgi:hypothetical protein